MLRDLVLLVYLVAHSSLAGCALAMWPRPMFARFAGPDHAIQAPFSVIDPESTDSRVRQLQGAVQSWQRELREELGLDWAQERGWHWYFSADGTIVATTGPATVRRPKVSRSIVSLERVMNARPLVVWHWADGSWNRSSRVLVPRAVDSRASNGSFIVVWGTAPIVFRLIDGELESVQGIPADVRDIRISAAGNWLAHAGAQHWETNAEAQLVAGRVSDTGDSITLARLTLTENKSQFNVVWSPNGTAAIVNSSQVFSFESNASHEWDGPNLFTEPDAHGHVIGKAGDSIVHVTLDCDANVLAQRKLKLPTACRVMSISPSGTQVLLRVPSPMQLLPGGLGRLEVFSFDPDTSLLSRSGHVVDREFLGWLRADSH